MCGNGVVEAFEFCDDDDDDDGILCDRWCQANVPPGVVGCLLDWPQKTEVAASSTLGAFTGTRAFFGATYLYEWPRIIESKLLFLAADADTSELDPWSIGPGPALWGGGGSSVLADGKWSGASQLMFEHVVNDESVWIEATVVIDSLAGSWLVADPEDPPRLVGHLEGGASGSFEALYCDKLAGSIFPE